MQGQRSIFDPFPETVDLNQGSNSNSTNMDGADDWNNMFSPMERPLLNNDLSNELNFSCVNTNRHNNFQSFRSWDVGESSSRASLHDQVSNDGQNLSDSATTPSRLEQLESSTARQVNMQNPVLNCIPMNVNLNVGYESTNTGDDSIGPFDYGPGSSMCNWGLSCKRTLEGTSTQSLMGGCLGSFPEASRSLNISSAEVISVPMSRHETPNIRIGVPESSPVPTPFVIRGSVLNLNNNNNDNVLSNGNLSRRPDINSSHQSLNRQIFLNEFLDQSRGQIGNLQNQQPSLMHAPDVPRNAHYFPWGNNISSRSGDSSSLLRNNVQYRNFVSPSEGRHLVHDPINWSLATGSDGATSSSRNGIGNGRSRPSNGLWTSQPNNCTMPSQQRLTEFAPWTLFPSAEESRGQRGHISLFPAVLSSSDNHISSGVSSQRNHYQPSSRAALLMEVPVDDWRALAADIEGRERLVSEIRLVLNAMRRGENVRAEDYMLFDPFINGVAELHDRHRDMRLDVDNMSYEELLALEERIGNVNTGLSEEVILKSMKQRKHIAFMAISTQNLEPCCICQEEYDTGDHIGSLDCGHDFHTDCIKQWLAQKNICPICKMTGLAP